MDDAYDAVDAALTEIDRLRQLLRKRKTSQVRSSEECSVIKAVCITWFRNHRPLVRTAMDEDLLADADRVYQDLLAASERATSRGRYNSGLNDLRSHLTELRRYAMTTSSPASVATATSDAPPSFASLVSDPLMQAILKRRWVECSNCVSASAPLAAIVMMGGLLEALLLARVHKTPNKAPILVPPRRRKTRPQGRRCLCRIGRFDTTSM